MSHLIYSDCKSFWTDRSRFHRCFYWEQQKTWANRTLAGLRYDTTMVQKEEQLGQEDFRFLRQFVQVHERGSKNYDHNAEKCEDSGVCELKNNLPRRRIRRQILLMVNCQRRSRCPP